MKTCILIVVLAAAIAFVIDRNVSTSRASFVEELNESQSDFRYYLAGKMLVSAPNHFETAEGIDRDLGDPASVVLVCGWVEELMADRIVEMRNAGFVGVRQYGARLDVDCMV